MKSDRKLSSGYTKIFLDAVDEVADQNKITLSHNDRCELFAGATISIDHYNKGVDAEQQGNYAMAIEEYVSSAENGNYLGEQAATNLKDKLGSYTKKQDKEIIRAVTENDLAAVKSALANGASARTHDGCFNSILSITLRNGNFRIAEVLLRAGAIYYEGSHYRSSYSIAKAFSGFQQRRSPTYRISPVNYHKAWVLIYDLTSHLMLIPEIMTENNNLVHDVAILIQQLMFIKHCQESNLSFKEYLDTMSRANESMKTPEWKMDKYASEADIISRISQRHAQIVRKEQSEARLFSVKTHYHEIANSLADIIKHAIYGYGKRTKQILIEEYLDKNLKLRDNAPDEFKKIYNRVTNYGSKKPSWF